MQPTSRHRRDANQRERRGQVDLGAAGRGRGRGVAVGREGAERGRHGGDDRIERHRESKARRCDDDGDSALGLVSSGTLTVCTDVPYPPMEFEDPDAEGGFTGFDIELMRAIADGRLWW